MSWLDEQLRDNAITRTGEVAEARVRPWGTVLRADTTRGPVWLKAPGPETVFEVELYQLLREAAPDHVLPPLGVDVGRGWVLLPDGGTSLGDQLADAELIHALTGVLPQYAQFQRDLAPHAELVEELDLACWVAVAARALTWERAMRSADADAPVEFTKAPWESLRALLAKSWLACCS